MIKQIIDFSFIEDPTEQERIIELAEELEINDYQTWGILEDEYEDCVMVLKYAKVVRADEINLKLPHPAGILQPHIKFELLLTLELDNCFLVNIEFLINLNAPLLEILNLSNNLITSIKSLRKCNFFNLSRLSFENNRLLEGGFLSQIKGSNERFALFLEEFDSEVINQNLNFLVKMQLKTSSLYCENEKRIENNVFWKMIRRMNGETQMGVKIYKYNNYGAM